MHITKPDNVLLLQGFEKRGNQCYLIATVGYVLDPDGQLLSEQSAWQWLAPQFPDEPFDVGLQKRRGTFGVAGNAYAPDGQPVARMALRVRFGGLEKMLHVYGDRQWQRGLTGWTPSGPKPFLHMPVDLAHALGGSEHLTNPYGKGLASPDTDLSGIDLPNIEWPDAPIRTIHDRPPIATFGNLPATDPALAAWAGTFDEKWESTHFPWLPDDVDPRYFDRVAQDQCADHYWLGNERWSIEGMHPSESMVEGVLPGLQPQLLWLRAAASPWTPDETPSVQRAELMLDTVWLFPESGRQVLLYRACLPVQREDGADIEALWIDTLPSGAPISDMATQLTAWSDQSPQIEPRLAAATALSTGSAAATAATKTTATATGAASSAAAISAAADPQTSITAPDHNDAPVPVGLPSANLSTRPDAATITDAVNDPATVLHSDPLDAANQSAPPVAAKWDDALWDEICREYAQAWDHARDMVRQMQEEQAAYGIVFPEVAPFVPPPKPGITATPEALPSNFAQSLQREVEEGLAQGQRAFEAVLRDNYSDDAQIDAILAKTRTIAETPITPEQGEAILENLPPELRARADTEIQALSAQFTDLNQRLAQLFEKRASGASATGLPDASAGQAAHKDAVAAESTATMVAPDTEAAASAGHANPAATTGIAAPLPAAARTNASAATTQASSAQAPAQTPANATANINADTNVNTTATNLRGVTLENQDYRDADLRGADLSGSLLTGCCFAGAVLNGASFKGAQLMSCDFTDAKMAGVQLQDMDARDTVFSGADWREAQAQRMNLTACDLNRIDATGADLSATQLDQCTLDDARLVQATLVGTTLSSVRSCRADFSNIDAEGLRIDSGTTLKKASFQHASMPQCSFMQSHFPESNWQDANIGDGLVLACDLRNTQAQRLHARNTVFKDSRIQDADWRQADLMHASFDYAIVERVDMSGSNLHGAQTRTANIGSLEIQDALLSASRLLQEHAHG